MVNHLRRKFVLVTMILLMGVLGILVLLFSLYLSYWNNIEMLDMVKWVSESGIFTEGKRPDVTDILAEENEDSVIVGIITDRTGNVISEQTLGNGKSRTIGGETVREILSAGSDEWKYGSYIYEIKELPEEQRLIVLLNTENPKAGIWRILGYLIIAFIALIALTAVSFLLSGFVTEPAKKELEREKQFIADASHELKTPLGAIHINAQALEMDYDSNIHVKNIISETVRMNRLLERLLTLARLEEDKQMEKSEFSLSAATEELVLTYESVAYEKKADYQFQIEEKLLVWGDEEEYKQLIAILLDNAIKHTTERGRISTELCKRGSGAVLTVKNTGAKIAEKDLPHVFERFYSSNHSGERGSFGLGLSIAQAIVMRMGGKIAVENQPDGVCFTVDLSHLS